MALKPRLKQHKSMNHSKSKDPENTRERAELRLGPKPGPSASVSGLGTGAGDTERLVHELQVYQVELEMQNEELQVARDAAAAAAARFVDLYDFAPVGYLTLGRTGEIVEANLTLATMLGIERSGLIGRVFGSLVFGEDARVLAAMLLRVFEGKGRQVCEVVVGDMVGPRVPVRLEAVAGETGEACRAVVTDVRERNRMEAERLILNKLECTGILAGGIAHDFNNLLAVIVLDVESALASWGGGGETGSLLEEAMRAALTARGLTQQLITFSKGGVPVRRPTHLAATIRDAVRLGLSGSRVRWEFDLAEDLWRADVDGDQIGQVVRALVLNAREAMPGGGVIRVRAWNEVRAEIVGNSLPAGDYVRVSVADHGAGIAPEVLPRIFDPYFSTKERGDQKGMGLGLTICHSIVRGHGGAIDVETVVGEGSVFHVHLPSHPEGAAERVVSGGDSGAWPRRVLVMDDDAPLRAVVGSWLRRMGHEAQLVADGGRAIEAYAAAMAAGRPFDAVLLDLTVRGGPGGVETLKALRVIDPGVVAIVMSGYADDPVLQDPLAHGFRAGLAKPFVGEGLREVFSRVAAGRRQESHDPRTGAPVEEVSGEGP